MGCELVGTFLLCLLPSLIIENQTLANNDSSRVRNPVQYSIFCDQYFVENVSNRATGESIAVEVFLLDQIYAINEFIRILSQSFCGKFNFLSSLDTFRTYGD